MKVMPGVFTSGASLVMARLRVFTSGFSPSTLTFSSGTGVSLSLQVNHDTPGSRQIGRSRPLQGTCSCSSCLPLVAGAPAAPGGQVAGAGAALHVTVAGPHLCPGRTQGCARGRGASAGTGPWRRSWQFILGNSLALLDSPSWAAPWPMWLLLGSSLAGSPWQLHGLDSSSWAAPRLLQLLPGCQTPWRRVELLNGESSFSASPPRLVPCAKVRGWVSRELKHSQGCSQ